MKVINRGGYRLFFADTETSLLLPYYEYGLYAGFPSPAAPYSAASIDLNVALMIDEENTRMVKVLYDELADENIFSGDLAILDISRKEAYEGEIAFFIVDGEEMFRKKDTVEGRPALTAGEKIKPIFLDEAYIEVKGIVTYTITTHVYTSIHANSNKDNAIDLNSLLITDKKSHFLGIVRGDSMINLKIFDGDLAVIKTSQVYVSGQKALCRLRDKFTVKCIEYDSANRTLWLMPGNDNIEPIKITDEDESVEVRGIVAYTITPHLRKFYIG